MNELEILDFEKNDDGNIQYTFRNQNTGEMVIMVGDDIFNDEIGLIVKHPKAYASVFKRA